MVEWAEPPEDDDGVENGDGFVIELRRVARNRFFSSSSFEGAGGGGCGCGVGGSTSR